MKPTNKSKHLENVADETIFIAALQQSGDAFRTRKKMTNNN